MNKLIKARKDKQRSTEKTFEHKQKRGKRENIRRRRYDKTREDKTNNIR